MREIEFALLMESEISAFLEKNRQNIESISKEFLAVLLLQQRQTEAVLKEALDHPENDPEFALGQVLNKEVNWEHITDSYLAGSLARRAAEFVLLNTIYAMVERTAVFYSQAAKFHSFPAGKMFFSTLSQLKHSLRRRIDGLCRINENFVWEEVGFAPYKLS
jgi:hypothetical protein